jgi:hypothetical protein
MAKHKNGLGILLIIAALFLVLYSSGVVETRSAKPIFDTTINKFDISPVTFASKAEVDDLYWIDVNVYNTEDKEGTMFLECGIYNKATNAWIDNIQSVEALATQDNCKGNEPNVQTVKVTLGPKLTEKVRLSVKVPSTVGGSNVIFCETFEQCWATDKEPYTSSHFLREITVLANDGKADNNNLADDGKGCTKDSECSSWMFWNQASCLNGYCVDKELTAPDMSSVKLWVSENKILVFGIAAGLLLIGAIMVYRPKKQQQQMM